MSSVLKVSTQCLLRTIEQTGNMLDWQRLSLDQVKLISVGDNTARAKRHMPVISNHYWLRLIQYVVASNSHYCPAKVFTFPI